MVITAVCSSWQAPRVIVFWVYWRYTLYTHRRTALPSRNFSSISTRGYAHHYSWMLRSHCWMPWPPCRLTWTQRAVVISPSLSAMHDWRRNSSSKTTVTIPPWPQQRHSRRACRRSRMSMFAVS
eukprot:PhF_6_TR26318/c0_g1_i1/m.37832